MVRICVVFAALICVSASVSAVPYHLAASADVTPLTRPGQLLSRMGDDELQKIILSIPEGSRFVRIRPDEGLEEGGTGTIEVSDAAGSIVQKETGISGLAIRLGSSTPRIHVTGSGESDPLTIDIPPQTARIEILSQYYDEDGEPQGDGAVRCYSRTGTLLLEEQDLQLDLFMF